MARRGVTSMSAHRFASWAAAAVGVSLTVAGVVAAPASARPHAAAAASPAGLQKLLNPSGDATVNPAEEETARQAFAASHFGGMGLNDPMALQQSLSRSIAAAAVVPQSTSASKAWKLRGPSTYLANDPGESGSLTNLGFKNLSGRATSIATTPRKPGLVWLGTADGGVWRSTDQGAHWKPMFDRQGTLAIGSV